MAFKAIRSAYPGRFLIVDSIDQKEYPTIYGIFRAVPKPPALLSELDLEKLDKSDYSTLIEYEPIYCLDDQGEQYLVSDQARAIEVIIENDGSNYIPAEVISFETAMRDLLRSIRKPLGDIKILTNKGVLEGPEFVIQTIDQMDERYRTGVQEDFKWRFHGFRLTLTGRNNESSFRIVTSEET